MRKLRRSVCFPMVAFALLAGINSCKKKSTLNDPGLDCISQTAAVANQQEVSLSDLNSIKGLFAANHLDATLYQFTSYSPDVGFDSTNTAGTEVSANAIVNGLPVFGSSDVFIFVSGKLDTAYLNPAKPSSNDSSGHQSLERLRSLFLQHVAESVFRSSVGSDTGNPDQVKDSCLRATLGYIDAGSVPGHSADFGISLVKVWSVSTYSRNFPAVYVNDSTGAAWGQVFLAP